MTIIENTSSGSFQWLFELDKPFHQHVHDYIINGNDELLCQTHKDNSASKCTPIRRDTQHDALAHLVSKRNTDTSHIYTGTSPNQTTETPCNEDTISQRILQRRTHSVRDALPAQQLKIPASKRRKKKKITASQKILKGKNDSFKESMNIRRNENSTRDSVIIDKLVMPDAHTAALLFNCETPPKHRISKKKISNANSKKNAAMQIRNDEVFNSINTSMSFDHEIYRNTLESQSHVQEASSQSRECISFFNNFSDDDVETNSNSDDLEHTVQIMGSGTYIADDSTLTLKDFRNILNKCNKSCPKFPVENDINYCLMGIQERKQVFPFVTENIFHVREKKRVLWKGVLKFNKEKTFEQVSNLIPNATWKLIRRGDIHYESLIYSSCDEIYGPWTNMYANNNSDTNNNMNNVKIEYPNTATMKTAATNTNTSRYYFNCYKPHITWIYGKRGTGKTRMAIKYSTEKCKKILKNANIDREIYFITSANNNTCMKLSNELCVIINNPDPNTFKIEEFLTLFDSNNFRSDMLVDDDTSYSRFIYITSIYKPQEYYDITGSKNINNLDTTSVKRSEQKINFLSSIHIQKKIGNTQPNIAHNINSNSIMSMKNMQFFNDESNHGGDSNSDYAIEDTFIDEIKNFNNQFNNDIIMKPLKELRFGSVEINEFTK